MEYVFLGIGGILLLVAFVCSIMVIVKMFQNQQTGLGIATIILLFVCGIGYIVALIVGWKNKEAWNLQKVMPIFTASFVVGLILYGIGYAIFLPKLASQVQLEMQKMNQQMPTGIPGETP